MIARIKIGTLLGVLTLNAAVTRAQTPLSNSFTYQGQLKENNGPANGAYDFVFRLFDTAAVGTGTQLSSAVRGDLNVIGGLFTVSLSLGDNFDGDARWLQIEVRPGASSGAYTVLTPRQEVTATPYALGVRLPLSEMVTTSSSALSILNNGTGRAGRFEVANPSGTLTALIGYHNGSGGAVAGVNTGTGRAGLFQVQNPNSGAEALEVDCDGNANSQTFYALHTGLGDCGLFRINNAASTAEAVQATTNGSGTAVQATTTGAGRAGYFEISNAANVNAAIYATTNGNTGGAAGAFGESTSATGSTYGVRGAAASPSGIGVYGTAPLAGVSGHSAGWGVLGSAGGNGAYGGFFHNGLNSSAFALRTAGDVHMMGGSVGIGTSTPERLLHVKGDAVLIERDSNNASLLLRNTVNGTLNAQFGLINNGTSDGYAVLTDENNAGVLYMHDNRAGVNTSDPQAALHVNGTTELNLQNGGVFMIGPMTAANVAMDQNEIMARNNQQAASLFLNNEGGDVIIAPQGNTRVRVLEITGADLAEKFPASEELKPGMVVAIDVANPGKLCLARGAYNRAVAGVVSGANNFSAGAVLGHLPGSEEAPPVALSGRVYVYSDATHFAIEPSDLLTTSDVPGYAAKATDTSKSTGAILGKAMTGLALGETGLVLVLVNLQ